MCRCVGIVKDEGRCVTVGIMKGEGRCGVSLCWDSAG